MTDPGNRFTARVADIMSAPPITIDVGARAYRAVGLLRKHGIRHLPVLRRGALVGVVSERDLLPRQEPVGEVMAGDPLDVEVGALMCSTPVVVTPEDSIHGAVQRMLERRIGGLPVVEAGSDTVVGMVTYVDVLRTLPSPQ
ncbi:MAG: CBS domain-containing protein [Myxococcota bacterium]